MITSCLPKIGIGCIQKHVSTNLLDKSEQNKVKHLSFRSANQQLHSFILLEISILCVCVCVHAHAHTYSIWAHHKVKYKLDWSKVWGSDIGAVWRLNYFWMWHCVIGCVVPNILQTCSTFIFLVSKPLKIKVLWLWNVSNNISNCSVISQENCFTAWWKCDLVIAPLFWEFWSYEWWSFCKVLSSRVLNSKMMSAQKFSVAFVLILITNEPQELAVWHLLWHMSQTYLHVIIEILLTFKNMRTVHILEVVSAKCNTNK